MNIVESVWNRIYLEFDFEHVIHIETSNIFNGYGKYERRKSMIEEIIKIILLEFNQKNLNIFSCNSTINSSYKYSKLNYIMRNYQFNNIESEKILSILVFVAKNSYLPKEAIQLECFINEINKILHKFNKEYIDDNIISVESELQSENIKSALRILEDSIYGATKTEYEEALKSYEELRFKNSITECNSSLESLLKCTCNKYGITPKGDTVGKLVESLNDSHYFKDFSYLIENLNHLSGIFKSGVNNIRNKDAAHGGGLTPNDPDQIIAKLALDLTTSYILYFVKSNLREKL